ncbi:MAG: sporulation protein [Bacteroidetes Order II. Incertae sedis bacterium]|nr:sporulation protein [Bacteroidetes Order II. bacterium]
MSFFDKAKKFLGMNTIELSLEAQPTFLVTDRTVTGIIKMKGVSDQVIKSVILEFYRESDYTHRDSEGYESSRTKKTPMGKIQVNAPSSISKDEEIQLPFEVPFFYEKTFSERMKEKDGMVGRMFKHAEDSFTRDEFLLTVKIDLANVALDPSQTVKIMRV